MRQHLKETATLVIEPQTEPVSIEIRTTITVRPANDGHPLAPIAANDNEPQDPPVEPTAVSYQRPEQ